MSITSASPILEELPDVQVVSNTQVLNGSVLTLNTAQPSVASSAGSALIVCECCANQHRLMHADQRRGVVVKVNRVISTHRRTFLAIGVFDLLCCFILWLFYTQAYGGIANDVVHFRFNDSLFDTVMCSTVRLTVIEIAYGLLRSSSVWYAVALTGFTIAFLISKIFIFDLIASGSLLAFVVLIATFLLTWFELWYAYFKMLRHERREELLEGRRSLVETHLSQRVHSIAYGTFSADPVVASAPESNTGRLLRSNATIVSDYYSPRSSFSEDDDNHNGGAADVDMRRDVSSASEPPSAPPMDAATRHRQELFKQTAKDTTTTVWNLFSSDPSGWRVESTDSATQTMVRSRVVMLDGATKRKYFRIDAVLDGIHLPPSRIVYKEMFANVERCPSWYSAVRYAKRIEPIDDQTDVVYTISADFAGGLIAARDYLSVRHCSEHEMLLLDALRFVPSNALESARGCTEKVRFYSICNAPVEHPIVSVCKEYIRGEEGPAGMLFSVVPRKSSDSATSANCVQDDSQNHDDVLLFSWIFFVNLKGWIPQSVLDKTTARVLFDFVELLSNRLRLLAASQAQ